MKRKSFTLIEALVALAILAIVGALLIPAFMTANHRTAQAQAETTIGSVRLSTIEYEGHKFVVGTHVTFGALAIVHSPNCPCQVKAERF
jgi:Tfp pilus assembly protein PilE